MKKLVLATAALSTLTLGAFMTQAHDAKAADDKEKCYGVAKAGKNDCGSTAHSCAGQAKEDGAADEWVFVPKGLCERIVGGSTQKPE